MTGPEPKAGRERRSLVEGMGASVAVAPDVEKQFVFAQKAPPADTKPHVEAAAEARPAKAPPQTTLARVPFTTRLRADYSAALKRASLERQLSGVTPNTLQEILEEALEPWLTANGYLTTPHP